MYKYKNYTYSLEEIQNAADKKNLSIDEYIKEYDIELVSTADETEVAEEVITDPTKEGKKKPATEESATVVEETVALEPTPVTEFKPVATSLELQKKIDNELKTTEVKTGTVANTEEVNKIYEKAAEDVPVALDEILKARERISTPQIKAQTASNYFNLEEVNRGIEQAIPTGFGTQSVSEKEPTQEEKEERIYNNGLNMPNATPESAQEYLDTYKNYIKTGELIPTDNQKEYLTKIQEISKEQLITTASQEIAGEYSEATQGIVENLINKNKDFKTIEEANSYIDESSKIFSNREKKFTKDIEQFNVDVNKWKNEINFIDKELENLNKKNNNFQNPAEYTQNSVDQYNALINKRNSLIKSSQAQVLEEQELNLSQEQSSLIDFQKTVTNKVLKFQNEESALRALEKDYSFSTRAALKMEQAFGGFGATSLAMLAKVGAELMTPGKYGGSFATVALDEKRDNTLIKTADNFLTSAIDYNRALEEKIAKVLPTSVTVKQVGEGKVSFGRFLSEAIANGSPTLVATLGPAGAVRLGSRLAGQAMLKPAMARAAANLSAVLLANQAGGGEMSSLLIAKEDAPLRIAQLEETLKSAKDPVEIQKINNEITNLRDSMNLSTAKIGFAGLLSAGIEGFTERFGTLALINKATPYVPGTSAFKKILTGGKTFGKGLLQENAEEVIAGISNNILVQNALLKRDVNVFEGVDLDLIANTTVVSAVMLGQGFGANTRSAFLELTTNVEEANRFQSLTRKLIDLQSSNSTDKRKQTKEILQQLGLENMISLSKLNTMTPQELQDLGNMQTQINKLNREASQFGVSMSQKGEITAADRNTLKKMEEQFEVLRSRKNDLLKTRRGGLAAVEAKEKSSGEQQINNPRFNFYSNSYNAFKVLTENMMPRGGKYIEFEKPEDLKFTEEQKQDFLENYNKGEKKVNKVKTFEEAVMRPNAWQDGNNIYVNLNGIYQQIAQNNANSASFAVASPLHELSHIRNSNLKLDKRLVNSAVDDAIKIIEANKNNLNKKDYESILTRFKQYQNTGAKYEEFMQVLSDAQTTGLINLSDYIDINSFKDLIKYTGAKAFGDLSEIFFKIETSNDVFNYINSYRTIVKKGTRIGSGDNEEIKLSRTAESIKQTLDKIDQINFDTKDNENKFKSKEEFRNSPQFGEVLQEMLAEDGLFDGLIIDKSGIDFTARNPQETADFIENVKGNLIKRFSGKNNLGNFDPTKNSLFGYFTGNNGLIVNAIKDVKKDFVEKDIKTSSLDTEAGETGSIREIAAAEEVDMDAFMAQTDAINESNITNLKLIKEELKTSDGKRIPELKEVIERKVKEQGPKLTEKELIYKNSPDYGTPSILKAINNSFQNSTEFKKLYDAKSKQLDKEIANGKTNREGQKISKANELQKFKTGYILRVEDFAGSGNLSQKKFPIAKAFIEQNIKLVIENLPRAAVTRKDPVSKKIENTSTGVPTNFLNNPNFYTKTEERIGDNGIFVYTKRKGISSNNILEMLEGKPLVKGKFGLPMQNAKQFINNLGQFATNQELRLQDFITPQQSANLEGGKDSKILFSLNTKGNGKWVQNPLNPLDNKNKVYSFKVGEVDYEINTFKDPDVFNYDIFEQTEYIEDEFVNNDPKSWGLVFAEADTGSTGITGDALEGLTNQFKVFGIVANSTIDLIKKEKLNSITFSGKEESRRRLYEAMVQKFQKELGWKSYTFDALGGETVFIVYDPKAFINPETAVTTEKESRILFNKGMPLLQKNNILKSVEKFQKNKSYANLNDDVFKGIKGVVENSKTYKQVFDGIKNLTFKTLGLNSQRKFERELLISLIGLANSKTKDSFIPAFETYRKLFKYEQQEVGYNFAVDYLNLKFKNAKSKEAKQEAITNFLKYISRSIKTLKIDGITTNKAVFYKIIKPLVKENNLGFKVLTENKLTYITLNGEKLKGLKDINEIKKDFNGSIAKIKDESEAVLKYYIEIINEAKENGTVEQIKGLIALTAADQRGMLRKLSTPGFEIVAPGKKMILEHETTALELFNKLIDYAESIDNVGLDALKKFVSQAKVNLIPESLDKILNVKGYIGDGKARYKAIDFVNALQKYKNNGQFISYAKESKNIINLNKSKSKSAVKNNLKLPKSQRLPKGSTNEQVLPKMQELDDKANEARINFSKGQSLDDTFNKIIENKTGIKTYQRFDKSGATVKGASKGKFNFFIPPSAEDFVGLLYKTLGKGKVGDSQMQFYKDNLLDPYARAMNDVSSARVAMFEDYKTLKEDLKIIPKDLNKKSVEEYTKEQAVRVYIWNQQENKIPGIFKTNQQKLVDYVNENPDLKTFADQLMAMQKGDGYVTPKEGWLAGTITTDLLDSVNSIKRKKYLEQWQTNVDEMFGETNMDKLEAAFGKPYRRALEDALSRMKSGRNKKFTTGNEQVDRWTNWVNNSVGTIMFLNSRSAILQTLSTVNFINFEDNNIFKAGAAFANQPQYWKDFKFLFNSDFLKERRGGLRFNVSESEIADAAKKGGARGVVSKILQAGFLPTQMADSFAIAAGGATFYRNRLNTYLKQTDTDGNKLYTEAEAQEKTFLDFRETAEESQQSSRPDRISMEQAGPLGRTILAFANTPAQYTRIMKKAALDIKNGRGSLKANVSRLIYYGVVQNIIFGAIQAAMFSLAFGDGDEEDQLFEEKAMRVANGTADSILRGAGLYGAIAATIKNTAIKLIKESKKGRADYFEAGLVELSGISPPIQSKVKKWRSATKSYEYNKKEMAAKGFSLDSPSYLAGANVIAAFTNLPTDRVVKKVTNVYDAMQEDVEVWKRTALLMGWSKWELEPTVKKAKKKKSSSKRKKVGRKTIQRKTIKRKTVK